MLLTLAVFLYESITLILPIKKLLILKKICIKIKKNYDLY